MNLIKIKKQKIDITNKIYDFNTPNQIYIPIFEDITFRTNDYVNKNTYFGDLVSSVSGKIRSTKKVLYKGKIVNAIGIDNDYRENSKVKREKIKINNKEELINELDKYHLNNIKSIINRVNIIDNLIITSSDEEIYSATEAIRLSESSSEILDTIDFISKILHPNKVILAIKNTNFSSINAVRKIAGMYPNINLELLPDLYLISHKHFISKHFHLDEEKTLVLKTKDIYNLYMILIKHKDVTENLITIAGNALKKGKILNVKLYSSLEDIIKQEIKINAPFYDIYLNGVLEGTKESLENIIITEDIHTIVINKKEKNETSSCINCGACKKICPFNINVKKCYFNKIKHKNCINCGLCNYICPARINLKSIVGGQNEK